MIWPCDMIKTSKGTILKEDAGMNKIDELLAAVKGYEVEFLL